MKNIYVIGSSNTDMVVQCDHIPAPGETILGGKFVQVHGGKGANQAVSAARLGGKVTFFCRVGKDPLGLASIAAYQKEGINTAYIVEDDAEQSGVALILVDREGENCIAVAPGVNAHMKPEDIAVLEKRLQPGDVILLQLEIPMDVVEYAARVGSRKKAIIILDPAPAPQEGLPDTIYQHLDYITPNETEAEMLAGCQDSSEHIIRELLRRGTQNVIITQSKNGCLLANSSESKSFPPYQVNAIDSTAAGDAFAGGLAVALAEGKAMADAIAWAQAAAALSVTKMGAQPSLPMREEVETFLSRG
ncbi:MAG: ribokinase [bacterium]|jgi:ribokinase